VFIGWSNSESYGGWTKDPEKTIGYIMTGCARSKVANRISFVFDFKGNISSYFNWTLES
jgi:acyl transferase domain-containing protein